MSETSRPEGPPSLDPVASKRWASWPHAHSPWLNEEIARRMEDRLQWIRLQPQSWVHWAPLTGGLQAHKLLKARYPKAPCHLIETSLAREQIVKRSLLGADWLVWLKKLFGSKTDSFGPPQPGGADMLWANMALHTSSDPQGLLQKWHQMLAVDGFLMFSCLGPDTLRELNEMYQKMGWPPACHAFTDMHDWGDMLVQAGFAEPVMDMERITLTYNSPNALLAEMRALGRNLHRGRFAGLRGRKWLESLEKALLLLAKVEQNGRLAISVEVIYGHALKPLPRLKVQGETTVALQDMRVLLGQSLNDLAV